MHIQNYLATLEFVNHERAARDLAPLDHLPAGKPGDPMRCVIARAVPGAYVGDDVFSTQDGARRVMPMQVTGFVREFDRGRSALRGEYDPAEIVEGGIDDDKGCLVLV